MMILLILMEHTPKSSGSSKANDVVISRQKLLMSSLILIFLLLLFLLIFDILIFDIIILVIPVCCVGTVVSETDYNTVLSLF